LVARFEQLDPVPDYVDRKFAIVTGVSSRLGVAFAERPPTPTARPKHDSAPHREEIHP
jgi:hypothetical protein